MAGQSTSKKRPTETKEGAPTKGARTAERILDAAEPLFADRGFDGASLREIAKRAGLQQPGLYNHFASKQALYGAVLDRALQPMLQALHAAGLPEGTEALREAANDLPALMTDLLFEHPQMASLFQQALRGEAGSAGTRLVRKWLDRLFGAALAGLDGVDAGLDDRRDRALQIVAMFNATTGYFLSQRALDSMDAGRIDDPDNVARQKRLLERIARAATTPAD